MDSSPLPEEGIDVDTNATSQDATDDSSTPIPEELTKKKIKGPAKKKRKGPAKEKTKEERERSRVWEHFTRLKDNENFCKCHYCEKTLSCPTTSGTSNLGKHLLICKQYEAFQKGNTQQVMRGDGSLQAGKVPESVVREATNEMIVLGELPFSFVESIAWRHFCSKVNLPNPISRRTSTRDIYEMYVERKATMKKWFSATKQRVSLTTDIWVAQATGASFMVITLHFIDADWHLRKLVIGFKYVIDHKGATIASVLLDCLTEWGVEKIFTITVDNATANTNSLSKFHREFKKKGRDALVLDGEFMHMQCCAHIINLIVKDGLRQVNENVDAIRNAVTYVRSSTKRMVSFDQRVDAAKICRGSLPLDVKTRWNSTHLMLSKAQKFRLAFDKMAAEDKLYNDYFLEVDNGKKRIGPPKFTDWVGIERLLSSHQCTTSSLY